MKITKITATLETTLKQLHHVPGIKPRTLYYLKVYGVTNMRELMAVDLIAFLEIKGVGKTTCMDLKRFQERYLHLLP